MSAPHDHPLVEIFSASITQLSVLLAAFHSDHPVVRCYNDYFSKKKSSARDTEVAEWLSALRLSPTPELESLMQPPMHELLNRSVLGIAPVERRRRVLSVGFALLQFLAIQHELKEELNLNGDTLLDLLDGSIVPCKIEGSKALDAMFLATEPLELKHRRGWDLDRFLQHRLKFDAAHTVYDPSLRPPTFKRVESWTYLPSDPILFDITVTTIVLATKNTPSTSYKRRNDGSATEEPPAKRGKFSNGGEAKKRSQFKPPSQGTRRSGRLARP
jgi:hypothetical protein